MRRAYLPAVVLTLLLAPPVLGRQAPEPDACNASMPDSVAHVKLAGVTEDFPRARIGRPVVSRDGCWVFVSVRRTATAGGSGVAVLRRQSGRLEQIRLLPVEGSDLRHALTHDGRTLIVHTSRQLFLVDVQKLISGDPAPVLGSIGSNRFAGVHNMAITADDRRLFMAHGETSWLSVIDLERARAGRPDSSAIAGGVPVGDAARGVILSRDERYLYVAAEPPANLDWPPVCKNDPRPNNPPPHREGAIYVVDTRLAGASGADAVVSIVPAGCFALSMALSPDGRMLYATAPLENALLAFDIGSPDTARRPKLVGRVPVGQTPRGIAVIDGGAKIVVSNANDFFRYPFSGPLQPGEDDVTIIEAARIDSGAVAVLGTIPAGAMPHSVTLTHDERTLLLTNGMSLTLQVVDLERLALRPVK